jgi:hypothetical protein
MFSRFLPRSTVGRAAAPFLLAAALLALVLLLLHHHGSQRTVLLALRAALDPLAASVAVQRAVQQHERVCGPALASRAAGAADDDASALRRVWQAEVEARSVELEQVLQRGHWELALGELAAMRDDWARLVERIEQRRIASSESSAAHRLIVEQLVTVVDLATLRTAAASLPTAARHALALHRPRTGANLAETELAWARAESARADIGARLEELDRTRALLLGALGLLAVATGLAVWKRPRQPEPILPQAVAPSPAAADAGSIYGDPPRSDAELQMRSLLASLATQRSAVSSDPAAGSLSPDR